MVKSFITLAPGVNIVNHFVFFVPNAPGKQMVCLPLASRLCGHLQAGSSLLAFVLKKTKTFKGQTLQHICPGANDTKLFAAVIYGFS